MNNTTLQIKFKQRLNKLASEDFDNIQCWEIVEAFNKAQLEWCRRQLRGANLFKDGDEMSKRRVDDLQILLKTMGLEGEDIDYNGEFGYFRADNFNAIYDDDYLEFKRIETLATQVLPGSCATEAIPPQPQIEEITEQQLVTPAVEQVNAEYVNIEEISTDNDINCTVGFIKPPPHGDSMTIAEEAMNAWNSGFTIEQMQTNYPLEFCSYQSNLYIADILVPAWEQSEFCDCVDEYSQSVADFTQSVDCEDWEEAGNIAWFDWDVTQEDLPLCKEVPGTSVVIQEGEEYWLCPNGDQYEYEAICSPAQEAVWETVVTVEGVPGTPGVPAQPEGHKILATGTNKNNCCEEERSMTVYLSEVANTDVILRDPLKNPNFDWGETIITMQDNEIRIWRKDFFIVDPKLIYYRKPIFIQVEGCVDPYTNKESTMEIECEFKDDIVELIIDEAVSIVAGDIMDVNQFSRGSQQAEKNN